MNRQANRLAHHLLRLGVEPETRVGIFLPRTVQVVVGVLGVLKAGAAYLPLDPSYPTERLAFMLRDSKAPIILTVAALRRRGPGSEAQGGLPGPRPTVMSGRKRQENPVVPTTADSAAYVLYTSGSTGLPKGVLGLHRGALNRFSWMWQTYPSSRARFAA